MLSQIAVALLGLAGAVEAIPKIGNAISQLVLGVATLLEDINNRRQLRAKQKELQKDYEIIFSTVANVNHGRVRRITVENEDGTIIFYNRQTLQHPEPDGWSGGATEDKLSEDGPEPPTI